MDFGQMLQQWWLDFQQFFETNGANIIVRVALAFFLIIFGHYFLKLIFFFLRKIFSVSKRRVEKSVRSFILDVLSVTARFILGLIVLSVLNVNLTGIATVISSGILAVGIALQDFIGNFASGVLIVSSKPFKAGDFIQVDGVEGNVSEVKMMTTSLITANGQLVIIPNKIITSTTITNFNGMPIRRGIINLSFKFEQDIDVVKNLIDSIVKKEKRLHKEKNYQIVVQGYNEIGYIISIRFHTPNSLFWDVTFDLNEKIVKILQENNIQPATKKFN